MVRTVHLGFHLSMKTYIQTCQRILLVLLYLSTTLVLSQLPTALSILTSSKSHALVIQLAHGRMKSSVLHRQDRLLDPGSPCLPFRTHACVMCWILLRSHQVFDCLQDNRRRRRIEILGRVLRRSWTTKHPHPVSV